MIKKGKQLNLLQTWYYRIQQHTHRVVILPARNRYERLYRQRTWTLLFDLAAIIIIMIMLAVAVFFWNHPLTSNSHIDLILQSNDEIISGQENHWQLILNNNNRNDLEQAYLSWHLPDSWHIVDLHSGNYDWDPAKNILFLNTLPAGSELVIDFTTSGWGDVINNDEWQIQLFYYNLDIKHNKTIDISTVYENSSLNLTAIMPDQIYLANPIALNYTLSNQGKEEVESRVVLLVPGDFIVNGYKSQYNDYKWSQILSSGDIWQQQLLGRLDIWTGNEAVLTWLWQVKAGDRWLDQGKLSYSVPVIKPQIDLDFSLDNELDYTLHADYQANVYMRNRQAQPLYNVRWQLEAADQLWQLEQTWPISTLALWPVDEEKFLTVNWNISDSEQTQLVSLPLRVRLSWTDDPASTNRYYIYSDIKNLFVSPSLVLSAQLYYFTPAGDQIGYGPLPPRVGWATSYWVSLSLFSDWGGFNNSAMIIKLAPGVRLLDYNSSSGVVYMDGDIRWAPGSYMGQKNFRPHLNLQLEIKPNSSQIGQKVELFSSATASAVSHLNQQEFTSKLGSFNNDMVMDMWRANDGRVKP